MKRKSVKTLVPEESALPMDAQVQRFVQWYLSTRDLKEAACKAGLMPEMGERLFRVPRVRQAIQKRINLIETECAKLAAAAQALTVPLLDSCLVEEVRSKKNGHIRVRAIELAYKRVGLIRDGEFVGVQQGGGGTGAPKTYGQITTTTVRRTLTEEMVQSSELPTAGDNAVTIRLLDYPI